ncbi:MAG TPA: histidine triad nucleotide-binding protein [Chlamydiales bacterium]|nr:histidine triad nucleotide-binding protein [Chlamydiales bacterium]
MKKSIFKQIIDKELPAKIIYEDEDMIVIHDAYPVAPVHILLIPKKEIPSMQFMGKDDFDLLPKIFKKAQEVAKEFGVEKGYRFLTNNGQSSGQTIFHLHFHLIGGRPLGIMG